MANQIQNMTPKEIVQELDKYIIGQDDAKKSVAIALRNRYRRNLLSEKLREEITPKNILMIGPTGCGKTEIARRLAKLMDAPFVKVEATKFTEVGYVGRDVDSMVRDLVEASVRICKKKMIAEKQAEAKEKAEEQIIDSLLPETKSKVREKTGSFMDAFMGNASYKSQKEIYEEKQQAEKEKAEERDSSYMMTREQIRKQLREGLLDGELVEITVEVQQKQDLDVGGGQMIAIGNIFGDMMPKKTKKRKVTVKEAFKILIEEEAQKLIDMDQVSSDAVDNAEQNGIIFIDEIDKIASADSFAKGAGVSREGVQRDILPLVEGSVVKTKYGPVKTDHILFIGAGAFHVSKPSDLIPELQGRFPIKVQLKHLTKDDFFKILTVPENAIVKQNKALLGTENINLEFTEDAIEQIATMAYLMNEQTENIGARRLHTIMEQLLEDISFEMPNTDGKPLVINDDYVREKFQDTIKEDDLDRYIL